MRGRKPKPSGLRLIQGNPGKRPINKHEAKMPAGAPSCPEHLDAEAVKEWKRLVPALAQLGLLTKVDRAGLAALCQNYSRWIEAEKKLAGSTLLIVNAGRVQPNPLIRIARDAMQAVLRIGVEYGLTPSSRSRIHTTPPDDGDGIEKFFFG